MSRYSPAFQWLLSDQAGASPGRGRAAGYRPVCYGLKTQDICLWNQYCSAYKTTGVDELKTRWRFTLAELERETSEDRPSGPSAFAPLSIIRAIWKRKIPIVLLWGLLAGCSVVIVRLLPAVYSSEALILVDSQKIPEKFVEATVSSNLQDRIATIKQQLLSTGNLKKIIDEFGLYKQERSTHFEEEILEMMRADISITLEESGTKRGSNAQLVAFRIGYQGSDPALVAQVANRLTNLYIKENLNTREVQAEGTSDFLETQLKEAKKRLEELEATVSGYKLQHNGELPEQEAAISGRLGRLQVELEANRDAINRAQQTKIILDNSLSAAEAAIVAQVKDLTASRNAVADGEPLPALAGRPAAKRRSEVLQQELDNLLARYRDNHPDVVRLRAELESAKRSEAAEASGGAEGLAAQSQGSQSKSRMQAPVPVWETPELARVRQQAATLAAQIKGAEKELETRKSEQDRILRDINAFQNRLERLPVREQEMARITRDYQMSKDNYKSLLDKKMAAEMALDMERRQKSERFTLLDPARVPEKPIKPKRPLLYALSCAGSLLLALLAGFGLEFRQNVMLGEWELPPDTPVLARLPYIAVPFKRAEQAKAQPEKQVGFKKRLATVFGALLSLAGVIAAGLYMFLHRA